MNINSFIRAIFKTKRVEDMVATAKGNSLKKTLGAFDLVMLGIGCTIGTGIFVLTGYAAAKHAGPSIAVSYFLAGLVCMLAALAYTELAAMVPVAGSAYTYSYAGLGEFVAWLVAWGLILEYTIGASTVAAGWSGYFVGVLKAGHIILPESLTSVPSEGGIINLPAVCVSLFIGFLLIRGTKESIVVNRILVAVKLVVIFLFLYIAVPHIKMENYADFAPFGWNGITLGAAAIFFAYIGFDSVATAAEETKNPNRDMPIGIIGSLLACAILYVLVSLALTGITHYTELGSDAPMTYALEQNGSKIGSALVGTGAVAGMMAVLLVLMYSQSRIFFVMSRDKLIPAFFNKKHKQFGTPYISCSIVTAVVAITSGFAPLHTLGDLTSLGTLLALALVSLGVLVLRIRRPDLKRPFKCPAVFLVAPLAIASCGYLIVELLSTVALPFVIWGILSVIVYFSYSFKRSTLREWNQ